MTHHTSTIPAGRLYIAGHAHRRGYSIQRCWSDAECSHICSMIARGEVADDQSSVGRPLRYVRDRRRAHAIVWRFNRRFASS